MRHKAEWMGRPMRLELTHVGLLVQFAKRYTTRGAHGCLNLVEFIIGFLLIT